ncbi:MAG TPA: AsmA-like C-terminal region-containing protein [Lentimicrobium sp.]|nr:AsmA-like C-terminal region-containing protein [Lentimicrobium sp.]
MQSNFNKKRLIIRLLLWVVALALVTALALLIAGFVNGDKIKQLVVGEINRHLQVPVEAGEVEFTLFRDFPDASVVFRNVEIKPPAGFPEAPALAHARSISLRMGWYGLLTGNYTIRVLQISNAAISMWSDGKGNTNYNIWKPAGAGSGKKVEFDIQRVILRETEVYYTDLSTGTNVGAAFPYFTLSGKVKDDRVNASLSGSVLTRRLLFNDTDYAVEGVIELQSVVALDMVGSGFSFGPASVRMHGLRFRGSGEMAFGEGPRTYKLFISASKADIASLSALAPETYFRKIEKFKPGGRIDATMNLSGDLDGETKPSFTLEFSIDRGSFVYEGSKIRFSSVEADGTFVYPGQQGKERLEISKIEGHAGKGRFSGRLTMLKLRDPILNLDLKADLYLEEFAGILAPDKIQNPEGRLIADVHYEGTPASGAAAGEKASGMVSLNNAGFSLLPTGKRIGNIQASLELDDGSVRVDQLSFRTGESDLSMNGHFYKLAAFLFSEGQPLTFEADLKSTRLRLEDLMPPPGTSGNGNQNGPAQQLLPPRFRFKASLKCDNFSYRRFSATQVQGNLRLEDQVLRLDDFSMKAMDGSISGSGVLNNRYADHAQLVSRASITDVDIQRLFYEFEDFGQTSLQSRHLRGKGDAEVQYGARMDNRLNTDVSSVSAIAELEIRNGQLVGFEPLQELSRFLDADELRNVKFSTLKNRIEIARSTVIIPRMEVRSSVMDLNGYGSHTFGNEIDYHINVLLSDIGKNRKRNPPPADASEITQSGGTRLFLHLSGTVDNPVFRYDRREVMKKMGDDFRNQREELRQVFRSEFGKEKKQPANNTTKQNAEKFEIEWDED